MGQFLNPPMLGEVRMAFGDPENPEAGWEFVESTQAEGIHKWRYKGFTIPDGYLTAWGGAIHQIPEGWKHDIKLSEKFGYTVIKYIGEKPVEIIWQAENSDFHNHHESKAVAYVANPLTGKLEKMDPQPERSIFKGFRHVGTSKGTWSSGLVHPQNIDKTLFDRHTVARKTFFKEEKPRKQQLEVLDLETMTVHKLVSICYDSKRVVMENEAYGRTSNKFSKVRILTKL